MAGDDRRAQLTGGRRTRVPASREALGRDLHGPVGLQAEFHQLRVHPDRRDLHADRYRAGQRGGSDPGGLRGRGRRGRGQGLDDGRPCGRWVRRTSARTSSRTSSRTRTARGHDGADDSEQHDGSRRAARPDRRLAFAAPHGVAQAFCLRRIPATAPMAPAAVTTRTPISRYFPVVMPWLVLPSPVARAPVGTAVTWVPPGVLVDPPPLDAAHVGRVMVFVSRVTVPLRASARPSRVAVVARVMDVSAMMVPRKVTPVPSDAELPTCQNTLQAWAPLVRVTTLPFPTIRSEPAWNTQTAAALPT